MQIQNPVLQGMEQGKRAHESFMNQHSAQRLADKQMWAQLTTAASQAKDLNAKAELNQQADAIAQGFMRFDQFGRPTIIANDWQKGGMTDEALRQKQAADTAQLNQNYQYRTYWDPVSNTYKRALQTKDMQNQIMYANAALPGEQYDKNVPYRERAVGAIIGPSQFPTAANQKTNAATTFWSRVVGKQ